MGDIYEPAEDSYFFASELKKYLKEHSEVKSHADMGCGSGILSEVTVPLLGKENVVAIDINEKAVDCCKQKGMQAVLSNLFANVSSTFDLITFNAPYLPMDQREPKGSRLATTGGKKGDEVTVNFLKQARKHLNNGGRILVLISSLTPIKRIQRYNPRERARKKVFMEDLIILEFGTK